MASLKEQLMQGISAISQTKPVQGLVEAGEAVKNKIVKPAAKYAKESVEDAKMLKDMGEEEVTKLGKKLKNESSSRARKMLSEGE